MDIKDLMKEAYEASKTKGFYEKPRTFGDVIALCHSELSEALEEYRKWGEDFRVYYREDKPVGIPIEFADVIIRIADYCGYRGIDLEKAIRDKLDYNQTRSHRHGEKTI